MGGRRTLLPRPLLAGEPRHRRGESEEFEIDGADVDAVLTWADLDHGGSRLRTLTVQDAPLVVEATSGENARALWGARPQGPYSSRDALAALADWDPRGGRQVSYGVVEDRRLLAAVGLMTGDRQSAEVAYWVRPEERRRGIASRAVGALTGWAHRTAGIPRLWLEVDPDNAASLRLARRAGYHLEGRLPAHCRSWFDDDPAHDEWHDCLILAHSR